MSNFAAWWGFCQLPENDGQAQDASPGEPYATRWGFTYPTWISARRYAGLIDTSMATFNEQTQAQMGSLAKLFFWERQGGLSLNSGVDVSVIDWCWTSGGAAYDIQRAYGVAVDGLIGPQTCRALNQQAAADAVTTIHAMRVQYYLDCGLIVLNQDGGYGGEFPGLGTRADACRDLAIGLLP